MTVEGGGNDGKIKLVDWKRGLLTNSDCYGVLGEVNCKGVGMSKPMTQRERLIVQRIHRGETYGGIGADLGISRQRVQQIAKKHGIKPLKTERKPLSGDDYLVAHLLETEPRLSYDEVAARYAMNVGQVKHIAERTGTDWIRKPIYQRGIQWWDYEQAHDTGCWNWRHGKDKFGHGRLYAGESGTEFAHRFSYMQYHGAIPKNEAVFHTCKNLACVNPEHLQSAPIGEAVVKARQQDTVEQQNVLYETDDYGVAILTLNNPQRRNALSARTLAELEERLDAISRDTAARVIIITAQGPVFSSGHDLNELLNGAAEDYAAVFDACTRVMEAIRLLPQPVIAQVQGLATAAGCQLTATCDLAVAADTAAFATPGVQIGLFCTTPGVAVARSVMPKKAMEMLLTGRPIAAQEARDCGLISRIVPADELETQTMELARQIASASAHTLALGKAAFYRQIEMTRPDAYQFAGKVMVDNLLAPDAQEGISAFLEKRPPVWTT